MIYIKCGAKDREACIREPPLASIWPIKVESISNRDTAIATNRLRLICARTSSTVSALPNIEPVQPRRDEVGLDPAWAAMLM